MLVQAFRSFGFNTVFLRRCEIDSMKASDDTVFSREGLETLGGFIL